MGVIKTAFEAAAGRFARHGERDGQTRITGYGHVSERGNFRLILNVSDVSRPRREFPMSEKNAIEWCSRLGAIYGV